MIKEITPLILTFNEEPNIGRTLQRLTWAERVVVIDSFSTDDTLEVLKSFPQVEVFQRKFDTHADQWNYGLQQVTTDWVLSLDADYMLTEELVSEIAAMVPEKTVNAYLARFKYCIFGKPLRATLLPPRAVLFRRERATYIDDGHTQLLRVEGATGMLASFIHHDDRKALGRWLWAQDRYMVLESQKLRAASELSLGDRLRRTRILAPLVVLFYCLFVQKGILDGWAGWYYALQRTLAETLLAIRLIEDEKLTRRDGEEAESEAARRESELRARTASSPSHRDMDRPVLRG